MTQKTGILPVFCIFINNNLELSQKIYTFAQFCCAWFGASFEIRIVSGNK